MGMRGVGAGLRNQAQAELDTRKKLRRFPWLKRGLNRAERVIAFLEFLPVTKGPLAGTRMKLLDQQLAFVRAVYATDARGRRKVRIGVKSEPKGNGKTGLVAGLCLCHLLGPEAEPRGEVYSAAIDRQQAGLIFAEMEAIIYHVPEFLVRVNISRFTKRIEVMEGVGDASTYEALSADARRAHGLAPSLFAYDELAQAKDRVLLDNLINGLGKRKEALGIVISTQAPDDEHPLSQLIDDGLSGVDPFDVCATACGAGRAPIRLRTRPGWPATRRLGNFCRWKRCARRRRERAGFRHLSRPFGICGSTSGLTRAKRTDCFRAASGKSARG